MHMVDILLSYVFSTNPVSIGEEYIIALNELENTIPRSFVFSSKNSLFETSQEKELKQIILG